MDNIYGINSIIIEGKKNKTVKEIINNNRRKIFELIKKGLLTVK